ncbi:MAG: PDZ domain-containing protein [Gammaproteobacteria bacterium]
MVTHTLALPFSGRFAPVKRAFQTFAVLTVLVIGYNAFGDSSDDAELRTQMAEAQAQLDAAAQRIAELSRKMSGGEMARVVKRMSVGKRKAMLGVRLGDAKDGQGVRIRSVTDEGPAERAGVEAGDFVQSINSVQLTGGSSSDAIENLLKTLKQLEPNDVASLRIMRDGRTINIDVTTESVAQALPRFGAVAESEDKLNQVSDILEFLPFDIPEIHADIMIDGDLSQFELDADDIEDLKQLPKRLEEAFGDLSTSAPVIAMFGGSSGLDHDFRFAPVTPGLGDYFGVKQGVLVTAVPDDNAHGIQEGDVLVSIGGNPVLSKHDIHAAFADVDEGESMAVELVRQRQSLTVDVVAPESSMSRVWKCLSNDGSKAERKRCLSKNGSSFSFSFDTDD